jgi:hypothetical protein
MVDHEDPFGVLGLDRSASVVQIRSARRTLARGAHPDHGGSDEAMRRLNAAFDAAIAHATGRRPLPPGPDRIGDPGGPWSSRPGDAGTRRSGGGTQDHPSFTIDALPAEAFEALLIVASWLGEVLADDPPYLLEVHLYEPTPCWCRLELVPDAGGSTVSLAVAALDDGPQPEVERVRDLWVANLNQLGRIDPDQTPR